MTDDPFFQLIVVSFLGLALGSFASALVYRVPMGMPWWKPGQRSCCPECKSTLGPFSLVPILSYVLQKGCCSSCKARISIMYPLTELLVLSSCLGVFAVKGLTVYTLLIMFCMPFLVALLVIDWRMMILPDQLVLLCGVFGLLNFLAKYLTGTHHGVLPVTEYVLGAIIYAGFAWLLSVTMSRVLGKPAMGLGDVKFFAAAGIWLGVSQLSWFCILSGILGIVVALVWKLSGKGSVFPFGPALIASLYLLLIF